MQGAGKIGITVTYSDLEVFGSREEQKTMQNDEVLEDMDQRSPTPDSQFYRNSNNNSNGNHHSVIIVSPTFVISQQIPLLETQNKEKKPIANEQKQYTAQVDELENYNGLH